MYGVPCFPVEEKKTRVLIYIAFTLAYTHNFYTMEQMHARTDKTSGQDIAACIILYFFFSVVLFICIPLRFCDTHTLLPNIAKKRETNVKKKNRCGLFCAPSF